MSFIADFGDLRYCSTLIPVPRACLLFLIMASIVFSSPGRPGSRGDFSNDSGSDGEDDVAPATGTADQGFTAAAMYKLWTEDVCTILLELGLNTDDMPMMIEAAQSVCHRMIHWIETSPQVPVLALSLSPSPCVAHCFAEDS